MRTFDEVIKQVDEFIRKYYKNLMIKGVLLFVIIFLFSFLLVSGLEYIGHFNSWVRGILFFSFLIINGYVLIRYFINPLFKLFSFGKRISRYQAAEIIGDFFPTVNDKLLNTLQLQDETISQPSNLSFLQASIQQRSKELNSLRFATAIDYKANRKFILYFLPILFISMLIGVFLPDVFSSGTERIIKYNQTFAVEQDFSFELQNKNLQVEEGQDLEIEVKLSPLPGKALPNKIYVETTEGKFLMKKTAKNRAVYELKNINEEQTFLFSAGNSSSTSYTIDVAKRTSLGHLNVAIRYPAYLDQKEETIENPGDLVIPEGTELTWDGVAKNAKSVTIYDTDTTLSFTQSGFRYEQRVFTSAPLYFVLENERLHKKDSNRFLIDVIKDQYPSIHVSQYEDSTQRNLVSFEGEVKDDYAVSRLIFHYTIAKKNGEEIKKQFDVEGISGKQSPFSMRFNIGNLPLEMEDKLSYYFVVFDNDGINGPKATRSTVYEYVTPSFEELKEKRAEEKEKASESLHDLMRKSQEFSEELRRFKKELAATKNISWEQQKQAEQLKNQQENLKNQMDETKKDLQESFEEKDKLNQMDEDLLEKQKQLEDLLDELMDDELAELLEDLQKMLDELNQKDLLQKLEETEQSSEKREKQLDRTLEMFKRMDVQERVEDLQESLEQLATEQEEVREDYNSDDISQEEAQKKQEELNEKFENIKEELEEMMDKNEDLKRPYSFDGLEELSDEIQEQMDGAKQDIEQGKKSSAQDKQEKAKEKMEEAAAQMQAQMQSSEQQQQAEDLESMRLLLANLMRLSFGQEENMLAFKTTDSYDPYFITLGREQRRIMDNLLPVKDSLRSLADRVPQVSSFIEQELSNIEKQYRYIPGHIGEREKRELETKQQFAMTGYNNLALMIDESIQNAQMQMQGEGEGEGEDGDPSNAGGDQPGEKGGEGDDGLQDLKDKIKKQLEELKNGQQPGEGADGTIPFPMNSQQAAKMAAEQSEMQKKLQELREKMSKDGSGAGNQMNELLKELEEQRESLINKKWDAELIRRQQDILTRLLESEKAMREQGFDEERESNVGKDEEYGNQIEFLEYKKQKEKQIELLRTLDPAFTKYYKEKANAYFLNINE